MPYYRNVITVEVLSDRPLMDEETDLETLHYLTGEGDCSGMTSRTIVNDPVSAERMGELLTAQGSSPEFLIRPCDECGATTPELVSAEHDKSCSLHPWNVVGV